MKISSAAGVSLICRFAAERSAQVPKDKERTDLHSRQALVIFHEWEVAWRKVTYIHHSLDSL